MHTRIHPFRNYIKTEEGAVYLKREDELGGGIGSKYRKLSSVINYLKTSEYEEVLIVGGAFSNNAVAAVMLFRQEDIKFKVVIPKTYAEVSGNYLYLKMLTHEEERIVLPKEEWLNMNTWFKDYQQSTEKKLYLLEEGCCVKEVLPGAITLANSIRQNEIIEGVTFQHIFTDCGTGMSAIGLLLGMKEAGLSAQIHIVLMASTKEEFLMKLNEFAKGKTKEIISKVHFYYPLSAKSFGSVNSTVLKEMIEISKDEGLLAEPVYSVKLFMKAKQLIQSGEVSGNCLVIYNGNSLGVAGFQSRLSSLV